MAYKNMKHNKRHVRELHRGLGHPKPVINRIAEPVFLPGPHDKPVDPIFTRLLRKVGFISIVLVILSSCIIITRKERCVVLATKEAIVTTATFTFYYQYKVKRIDSKNQVLWITDKYEYNVGDTIIYRFEIHE